MFPALRDWGEMIHRQALHFLSAIHAAMAVMGLDHLPLLDSQIMAAIGMLFSTSALLVLSCLFSMILMIDLSLFEERYSIFSVVFSIGRSYSFSIIFIAYFLLFLNFLYILLSRLSILIKYLFSVFSIIDPIFYTLSLWRGFVFFSASKIDCIFLFSIDRMKFFFILLIISSMVRTSLFSRIWHAITSAKAILRVWCGNLRSQAFGLQSLAA